MADREALIALGTALQDAWNDHCLDTGMVPDAFTIRGPRNTRVIADFVGSHFVSTAAALLQREGFLLAPVPDAPAGPSHYIASWVEGSTAGWFECACGERFTTEGYDSEKRSMGALFLEHEASL